VVLERASEDVTLTIAHDSLATPILLQSKLSPVFWYGNYFSGFLGCLVDLNSDKRFTYRPRSSYLIYDAARQEIRSQNWIPNEKGQWNLKISIPEGNHFYVNRGEGYGKRFGLQGFCLGLEYYYTKDRCINSDIGRLTDRYGPITLVSVHPEEAIFATYFDVQLGHDINRFHFDYGLQVNGTEYFEYADPSFLGEVKFSDSQTNLGLAFSAYYRLSNGFSLGLNYYPSSPIWKDKQFTPGYAHLLWFELIFRVEVKKNSAGKSTIWVAR
jgi:hypothetical protein